MAKSKISRVWNNVKYYAPKVLFAIIEFIVCVLHYAYIAGGCIFLVGVVLPLMLVLIFNPLSFLLCALIIPASAASWLKTSGDDDFISTLAKFCVNMVKWETRLLPWYAKKHFIAENPEYFKASQILKYSHGLENEQEKIQFFKNIADIDRPELIRNLWDACSEDERKVLLTAKVESLISSVRHCCVALRDDEVIYMLNHNMHNVMAKYIKYRTPSASTFQVLMDRVKDANSDIDCESWCVELIIAHGLSSELISWVYTQGSDKLKNLVENALRIHGQKDITKRLVGFYRGTDADEWKAFLEKTPEICAEAQMEMDYTLMVKMFYEAGHHMDERAIFHWLSKGKFINEIFTNEPENGLISPRIKALVSGSETLSRTRIYIQQRKA